MTECHVRVRKKSWKQGNHIILWTVVRGTGTLKDRDEVNRRDVGEGDG
jgi:hypothetical protein